MIAQLLQQSSRPTTLTSNADLLTLSEGAEVRIRQTGQIVPHTSLISPRGPGIWIFYAAKNNTVKLLQRQNNSTIPAIDMLSGNYGSFDLNNEEFTPINVPRYVYTSQCNLYHFFNTFLRRFGK